MPIDPLERYFPFDAGDGQYVSEIDWGTMAKHWVNDGVSGVPAGTHLQVTPTPLTPFSVRLGIGDAFVRGFFYHLGVVKDIVVPTWGDATGPRRDYVALNLDNTANTLGPVIVTGTKNTLPALPAGHMALADISVSDVGGITVVRDLRSFMGSRIVTFSSVALAGLPPVPTDNNVFAYDTALNVVYMSQSGVWVHVMGNKKIAATIATVVSGGGTWSIVQFPGAEAYGLYEATVLDPGLLGTPTLRVRYRVRSTTVVAATGFFSMGAVTLPAGYTLLTTTPITSRLLNTSFGRRTWQHGQLTQEGGHMWVSQEFPSGSDHAANEYFELDFQVPINKT